MLRPPSACLIGSMEDRNGRRVRGSSDNERVISTCSRAYAAHAHIAHSIEWLYQGHVRIPSLKLRPPLIVLVRKVTSPGAVNFAGPERSTRSIAVWFLVLSYLAVISVLLEPWPSSRCCFNDVTGPPASVFHWYSIRF